MDGARAGDEPTGAVEVRPAVGRFEDLAAVMAVKPGAGGCWCMSYRDSRVDAQPRR
ncbi:hypothetical protein [Georgenia sp. H159]|uniref:hypothetical protein n=1 Tax=Georgenia sp. H159 TaxID=3076115 RepID=UPI002D777F90|nr:hypothetical protein [Georgenia sp. H159]